jgi:CRP-like cAMP-binding protein
MDLAPTLLAGLSKDECAAVMAGSRLRQEAERTVLCRQDEPADCLFIVRTGRVRFARATVQGRDVLLRMIGPGECFGLASLVPGTVNYMATAVVRDHACIDVWDSDVIRAAAARYPRLSENALRIALEYLEDFGDRHVSLLSRTAEQRVARVLTHLGATSGRVLPGGVELEITNHDLAALSDVGMFTVSRQMKRWEREGHLLKLRERVILRHPEALLHA